jgi:hypothetical protein
MMTTSRSKVLVLAAPLVCLALGGCASASRFAARIFHHRPVQQAQAWVPGEVRISDAVQVRGEDLARGRVQPLDRVRPIMTGGEETPAQTPEDRLYHAAAKAIEARDYGGALDILQLARQAAPNDVRVLNALGVVYDKLGRFDLSARYYAQASAADPGSTIVAANIRYSAMLREARQEELAPLLARAPAPQTASRPPPAQTRTDAQTLRLANADGQVRRATPIFTGRPLTLVNASGRALAPQPARIFLASAGWTVSPADAQAPQQARSEIRFTVENQAVATALARTLPFKVTLSACAKACPFQLVLGRDAPQSMRPIGRRS